MTGKQLRAGPPPEERLGVWKSLDDVPSYRRLEQFEDHLPTDDPIETYLEWRRTETEYAESTNRRYEYAMDNWADWMSAEISRHPALADPDHANQWIKYLLTTGGQSGDGRTIRTVWATYQRQVQTWYKWMMWRADYPHQYNPFWMAAAVDGPARDVYFVRGDPSDY